MEKSINEILNEAVSVEVVFKDGCRIVKRKDGKFQAYEDSELDGRVGGHARTFEEAYETLQKFLNWSKS